MSPTASGGLPEGRAERHADIGVSDGRRKRPNNAAATGASAAGIRAISAQMIAFYFRAPVKAFFRTRVE